MRGYSTNPALTTRGALVSELSSVLREYKSQVGFCGYFWSSALKLRPRHNLYSVSNVCEVAPIALFLAPNGVNEWIPSWIGAFLTSQPWRLLTSWAHKKGRFPSRLRPTRKLGTTFGWLERNITFHFDKIVVPCTAFLYLARKYNNLVPSRLLIWQWYGDMGIPIPKTCDMCIPCNPNPNGLGNMRRGCKYH